MKFKFNYIKTVGNMKIDESLEIEDNNCVCFDAILDVGLKYLKEIEENV